MTRLPLILSNLGAVLAAVCVMTVRNIVGSDIGVYVILLVLLGYCGVAGSVAYLVGYPEETHDGPRDHA
jgi:hypothetical protein